MVDGQRFVILAMFLFVFGHILPYFRVAGLWRQGWLRHLWSLFRLQFKTVGVQISKIYYLTTKWKMQFVLLFSTEPVGKTIKMTFCSPLSYFLLGYQRSTIVPPQTTLDPIYLFMAPFNFLNKTLSNS